MWPWQTSARPLYPAHASAIGLHLLTLDADDRYARFGHPIGDQALLEWVCRMNWQSVKWWGIWCLPPNAGLAGALQLSRTNASGICELALSVHHLVRRRGLGTALLSLAVSQSPETERLVCHHGHEAVRSMARRLGWRCWVTHELGLQIDIGHSGPAAG